MKYCMYCGKASDDGRHDTSYYICYSCRQPSKKSKLKLYTVPTIKVRNVLEQLITEDDKKRKKVSYNLSNTLDKYTAKLHNHIQKIVDRAYVDGVRQGKRNRYE